MRSFFRAMLECRDVIYSKRDRPAADVYSSVETFLKEGRYSSYRKANELSAMKLSRYSEDAIASQLGVSVSTVRTHSSNVSAELYGLFGVNFFDMLSNYAENSLKVNTVLYRIKHQNEMAVSYVLSDALHEVKSRKPYSAEKSFSIKDCGQELDFLRRYSRQFLSQAIKEVDMDKVMYLIDVLDGLAGTPEDWVYLVSHMTEED